MSDASKISDGKRGDDDDGLNDDATNDPFHDIMNKYYYFYESCREKYTLDKDTWDKVVTYLESDDNEDEKHKKVNYLGAVGFKKNKWENCNVLMAACLRDPPLKVVELLAKYGGLTAMTNRISSHGHTAFHCACLGNAKLDVIKFLWEESIRIIPNNDWKKNEWGYNGLKCACLGSAPLNIIEYLASGASINDKITKSGNYSLHILCRHYPSNLLVEAIEVFLKHCKIDAFFNMENENGSTPFDELLRREAMPIEVIVGLCVHANRCTDLIKLQNLVFKIPILDSIEQRTYDEKGKIMATSFMKNLFNEKFVDKSFLAGIMLDLWVQMTIVVIYSFFKSVGFFHPTPAILWTCVVYLTLYEAKQFFTTSLSGYFNKIDHILDILQIGLIYATLFVENIDSHENQGLVAFTTFIVYIELLLQLRHFNYKIAVFVVAMRKVIEQLAVFIFAASFLAVTFAHVYYNAGPNTACLCDNLVNASDESNDFDEAIWMCSVQGSIYYSFAALLSINDMTTTAVPTWISFLYAFIITLIFLNVIIVIIQGRYTEITHESEKAFYADRFEKVRKSLIARGIGLAVYRFSSSKLQTHITVQDSKKWDESKCRFNWNSTKYHPLTQSQFNKEEDEKDENKKVFFNWSYHPLTQSQFKKKEDDKDENKKEFFNWWYGKDAYNRKYIQPTLIKGFIYFLLWSRWKDIYLPGNVFEKVIAKKNRLGGLGYMKPVTVVASLFFMIAANTAILLTFVLGFFSLGLLWPLDMRKWMFFPTDEVTNNDYTIEMTEMVEDMSFSHLELRPREIWRRISTDLSRRSPLWTGLTDKQVIRMVGNIREKALGGDIFRKIESHDLSMVKDSRFRFLQCNVCLRDPKTETMERIIVYGNPQLFGLLKIPQVHLYVDATFSITPHQFHQCLTIMAFDASTDAYVPILYILMTAKTYFLYYHALHYTICASDWKLDPFSVTCDYERGLINAVKEQFPDSRINGCLFHWKQAIRRKMGTLSIDRDQISMAMTKNVLDVLTVIPRNEIMVKGIPYVKSCLEDQIITGSDRLKWNSFWEYFESYWCATEDMIQCWNIIDRNEAYNDLQNRTNNALERYNRAMNELFETPHPSLLLFAQTVEVEAREQFQRLNDIRIGIEVPYPLLTTSINEVPFIYTTFIV